MICFLTWSLSFNPAILKVWPSDLWKSEIFSGVPMLKTIFFVNGTFFVIFFLGSQNPADISSGRIKTVARDIP